DSLCLIWLDLYNFITGVNMGDIFYDHILLASPLMSRKFNLSGISKIFRNVLISFSSIAFDPDLISVIFGSLLGDSHLERRSATGGSRLKYYVSAKNSGYLLWIHNFFAKRGLCSPKIPQVKTQKSSTVGDSLSISFNTYTNMAFNWIHDMFYVVCSTTGRYIKRVPENISDYLTPLALAIWFMDDGSKTYNTCRIATNSFTLDDINLLCKVLQDKYDITATPQLSGVGKGYILYIHTSSFDKFASIVRPHMHPDMLYKLGE
nr:hypothetical protein 261 - Allomyces macrogynus mitochondrion [Allomyces macrogynus]